MQFRKSWVSFVICVISYWISQTFLFRASFGVKMGHYFLSKEAKLIQEDVSGHTFRPVEYYVFQSRVLSFNFFEMSHEIFGWATYPCFLCHAIFYPRSSSWSAWGPPYTPFFVVVSNKSKRGKPFVPFIMEGT